MSPALRYRFAPPEPDLEPWMDLELTARSLDALFALKHLAKPAPKLCPRSSAVTAAVMVEKQSVLSQVFCFGGFASGIFRGVGSPTGFQR